MAAVSPHGSLGQLVRAVILRFNRVLQHGAIYPFARQLAIYQAFHEMPEAYRAALLFFHKRWPGDDWIAPVPTQKLKTLVRPLSKMDFHN